MLVAGFRESKLTRIFPEGWCDQARRFSPASLAGHREQVFAAARAAAQVEHSVVVFTRPGEPGLSAMERESLWETFAVPVFEQYLGFGNELLASECDAHAGLHAVNGYEDLDLEYDVCACGNPAPRLIRGARIDELAALLS